MRVARRLDAVSLRASYRWVGRFRPAFLIRDASVVGLTPSSSAAPPGAVDVPVCLVEGHPQVLDVGAAKVGATVAIACVTRATAGEVPMISPKL